MAIERALNGMAATQWPAMAPLHAVLVARCVELSWPNNQTRQVNVTWLRDNCPCNECRIGQTGEHRFFLGAHAGLPEPVGVRLVDGDLTIDWEDGHRTIYTPGDFERIVNIARRRHVASVPWADDFMPTRFDHHQVLTDHSVRQTFLETTLHDGMSVITGVPSIAK